MRFRFFTIGAERSGYSSETLKPTQPVAHWVPTRHVLVHQLSFHLSQQLTSARPSIPHYRSNQHHVRDDETPSTFLIANSDKAGLSGGHIFEHLREARFRKQVGAALLRAFIDACLQLVGGPSDVGHQRRKSGWLSTAAITVKGL
jgi:hypothetical protein